MFAHGNQGELSARQGHGAAGKSFLYGIFLVVQGCYRCNVSFFYPIVGSFIGVLSFFLLVFGFTPIPVNDFLKQWSQGEIWKI